MPLEMNPEIRAQWCEALRSGEYKQGAGKLCKNRRMCCLGVLTDLAVKAGVVKSVKRHPHGWTEYDGCSDWLPSSVQAWAGLPVGSPQIDDPSVPAGRATLAILNDEWGRAFAEIADLIDGGTS